MFAERWKNNRGYTFLELFISLSIFALTLFFLVHTVPLIQFHGYGKNILNEMEWEIFLNQTKRELRNSEKVRLTYNRILLYQEGKIIQYEKYGRNLRRRVNSKGHEIILFNISSFSYEKTARGIRIIVEHGDGRTFQEEMYIPDHIPVEVGT